MVDCSRQMVRQHGSCVDRSAFLSFGAQRVLRSWLTSAFPVHQVGGLGALYGPSGVQSCAPAAHVSSRISDTPGGLRECLKKTLCVHSLICGGRNG